MKFDKSGFSVEDGMLYISIKSFLLENDDFERGEWNLSIPYSTTSDSEAQDGVKEIIIDKKINDMVTVDRLFVSRYQLIIFSEQSSTEHNKEYIFRELAVYDQDGNQLSSTQAMIQADGRQSHMFSTGNKDISKIKIYYTNTYQNLLRY